MINTAAVQAALDDLALRLQIPTDLITLHRQGWADAEDRQPYTSLRFGAFLLAYSPFERFLTDVARAHGYTGDRAVPVLVGPARKEFTRHLGLDVTATWAARVRVAPAANSSTNIAPWTTVRGAALENYLRDANELRNLLAHGTDGRSVANHSQSLHPVVGGHSFRLMWAEGFLRAVQDLASITALTLTGNTVAVPQWPTPPPGARRPPAAPY